MSLLSGENNERTISGTQTTVLRTLHTRPGRCYLIKNQQCAAPTVEQHTHTKTNASFPCKNTPKNSIVQCAATQKFTQNAQQTSQAYSHS